MRTPLLTIASLAFLPALAGAQVTNIAPLGVAQQSSTILGGEADRAIDGNTSQAWGLASTTHRTEHRRVVGGGPGCRL